MFVHEALLEAIRCGNTEIPASDLRTTMNELEETDTAGENEYQKQFLVSGVCLGNFVALVFAFSSSFLFRE